jgi:hypothetical protein
MKHITIIGILIMIFNLFGCSGQTKNEERKLSKEIGE